VWKAQLPATLSPAARDGPGPGTAACGGRDEFPAEDCLVAAGPGGTQPGPVPLRIVTDAVGFCQQVASRARPT
jgi:hypothetical protein